MKKRDRRWIALPVVLVITVAKNVWLVPRLHWGVTEWTYVELPLTAAMIGAAVSFGVWAVERWRLRGE